MNVSRPEDDRPVILSVDERETQRALVDSSWNALVVVDESCCILALNAAARKAFDAGETNGETLVTLTGSTELETIVRESILNNERVLEE